MKTWQSILLGIFLGILFLSGFYILLKTSSAPAVELQPAPTPAPIVVQVAGAVARPGLYTLPRGARQQDAIQAAGGFTAESDQSAMNLAARLRDGEKITIPALLSSSAPTRASGSPLPAITPTVAYPLDLNTATLEELDTLPGIGPTRAQDIIDYRDQHGGFKTIDELKEVRGIGDTTFARIKDLVTVQGADANPN